MLNSRCGCGSLVLSIDVPLPPAGPPALASAPAGALTIGFNRAVLTNQPVLFISQRGQSCLTIPHKSASGGSNEPCFEGQYRRIYLILVGCCGCMLDVVKSGDLCGDRARSALKLKGWYICII